LLNSAVYLLQLIQQISTFAINYQGRPFRENLSENRGMYLGILGVSALAFSCSTEFIPELNEQMKLVPFTSDFKVRMTGTMLVDYVGCYVIEKGLKWGFSDYRPKDIAIRRPEQIAKEEARKKVEAAAAKQKKVEEEARKEKEKIEKAEKAMEALRVRWNR
jgi:cation-transporting ATPase 13A1